ncbi:MAG TPA: hypothetical protein ENK64_01490 [Flavobacteriales bacterium]|jgi:hypothetical protein|nr:hypothetical protein [Flavobacteriales bacterium]
MNKFYLMILSLLFPLLSIAQFDSDTPKIILYDNAMDIGVYTQMVAKDKLYLIYNLQKEEAGQELDYAMAMIAENLSNIDLNEENPQIVDKLRKIKEVWHKLSNTLTLNLTPKEFTNLFFEINTFDRLVSDLIIKMREVYTLPSEKLENYNDIQHLRKAIQKINLSYYANYLGLSKSFMHEYQKNIAKVNAFVKEKSNQFLNDPVAGKYFSDVIVDWNFLKANLLKADAKNPKTVFSLVASIDYKLRIIKNAYIENLSKDF